MRILIFSATTGTGHNQAANNLKSFLEDENVVEVVNLFNVNKVKKSLTDSFFDKSFLFLANKMPNLYRNIYNTADWKITSKLIKNLFISNKKSIMDKIIEFKPDVILSSHPYSIPLVLSQIKNKNIPFIQVVTDFKAHNIYVDSDTDAYIVGSDYTKNSLIDRGIKETKINIFGIPIRSEFYNSNKVKSDKFRLLIMGGGMGLDSMELSIRRLLDLDLDIVITVVCGSNVDLKLKLEKDYKNKIFSENLKIYGYTNNISEIMDNSDVIVTKPGGLTTTECIAKRLPMIIPFYIAGQEEENIEFLKQEKLAIVLNEVSELPKELNKIISNKEKYNEYVSNLDRLASRYSLNSIKNLIDKIVLEKKK